MSVKTVRTDSNCSTILPDEEPAPEPTDPCHHAAAHDDSGWHAAEHQAEHRVAEKTGFGLIEHAVDRVAESTTQKMLGRSAEAAVEHAAFGAAEHGAEIAAEKIFEHGAEAVGEHLASGVSERLLERSAKGVSERLLEHTAEAVGERMIVRGVSGTMQLGKKVAATKSAEAANMTMAHSSAHGSVLAHGAVGLHHVGGMQVIRVLIPTAGLALLLHMAHQDWHRAHREWHQRGLAFTTLLFLLAALGDSFDAMVHMLVVASLTVAHIDHHLMHALEFRSMCAAAVALLTMVAGELLSGRASRSEKSKTHSEKAKIH